MNTYSEQIGRLTVSAPTRDWSDKTGLRGMDEIEKRERVLIVRNLRPGTQEMTCAHNVCVDIAEKEADDLLRNPFQKRERGREGGGECKQTETDTDTDRHAD